MIYLDWAASAPMYPEALEELRRCAEELYANPGGVHAAAGRARAVIHGSRRILAELLGVPDSAVYFCSGGTEANNWAFQIAARHAPGHLLVGACEHKSVLESARALEASGFRITLLRPDAQGQYSPAAVESALHPDTRLLSIQAANNETGAVQDISALADLAHAHGVLFHCDAAQSFGHLPLPLHRADLVSLSAHKLGGPRGVGVLMIRQGLRAAPMIRGGGQELGLRSGTENTPAISAFALAASLACGGLFCYFVYMKQSFHLTVMDVSSRHPVGDAADELIGEAPAKAGIRFLFPRGRGILSPNHGHISAPP